MADTIKKTLCPINERLEFLPKYAGAVFLQYEHHIYNLMGAHSPDYNGGYWEFYHLSNGGFFMALASDEVLKVEQPSNYFDDTMSAEAFSIGANLYALCLFAEQDPERFAPLFHKLRDFAIEHDEAGKILGFID